MKESKVVSSLREAIRLSGLKDGMCVSFHHHLRNGDYVVNMVMEQISAMGIRDLTVNASALFDVHLPMLEHIKNGTVSKLLTNYMSAGLGRAISEGVMEQPVEFRTHGGRPRGGVPQLRQRHFRNRRDREHRPHGQSRRGHLLWPGARISRGGRQ